MKAWVLNLTIGLFLVPVSVLADTITVCPSGCDETTVGAAVASAVAWDTVSIYPGTYVQTGYVLLDKPVRIQGSGPDVTFLEQGGYGSVFFIPNTHPVDSVVVIEGITVSNGDSSPSGSGGAIRVGSSSGPTTVEIRNCVLESNTSGYGGAIKIDSGNSINAIVDSTLIQNNSAITSAGAIEFGGDTLTITNSAIIGNEAWLTGGVFLYPNSRLVMVNTTVASNTSLNAYAGGIYGEYADMDISFSTIANNTGQAGYIGGFANYQGTAIFTANILNNPGSGNCFGAIASNGYNIDDDSTCGLSSTGDVSGQSPDLGAFVDMGDHRSHYPLLPGSIAIDHAAPALFPPVDQRHIVRPQDGDHDGTQTCDSGAIEMEEGPLFEDGFETGDTLGWSISVP